MLQPRKKATKIDIFIPKLLASYQSEIICSKITFSYSQNEPHGEVSKVDLFFMSICGF